MLARLVLLLLLLLPPLGMAQQDTLVVTRDVYLVIATPASAERGVCATYPADIVQFQPIWDTYSGSGLFVNPVPVPLTSWQQEGRSYHRSYLLDGLDYAVVFHARPRGLANLVILQHEDSETARALSARMLEYLEAQETPCLLWPGEARVPTEQVQAGDLLEVALTVRNLASFTAPAGAATVRAPVPSGTRYLPGSTRSDAEAMLVEVSQDGRTYQELDANLETAPVGFFRFGLLEPLEPGETRRFSFRVQVE